MLLIVNGRTQHITYKPTFFRVDSYIQKLENKYWRRNLTLDVYKFNNVSFKQGTHGIPHTLSIV